MKFKVGDVLRYTPGDGTHLARHCREGLAIVSDHPRAGIVYLDDAGEWCDYDPEDWT